MSDKGHYWYDKKPNECPICKKKFYPAPLHAWKIGDWRGSKLVCSYTCMRVWEKDRTVLDGNKKTYNTVGAESKRTRK